MFLMFILLGLLAVISYAFTLPDLLKAFLVLPFFLFFPLLVGRAYSLKASGWEEKVISWCLGIITMIAIAFVLFFLHIFSVKLVLVILIAISLLGLRKKMAREEIWNPWLLAVIASSLLPLAWITFYTPYPLFHDVDQFSNNIFVWNILHGEFPAIPWNAAYLPVFHTFLALGAIVGNLEMNSFPLFWTLRFLIYPLYALGVFLFVYEFSQNKKLAFLSALIAPWFTVEYVTLINTAPKIFSYVFTPYLFFLALKNKKLFLIGILTALFLHKAMGGITVAAVLIFLLFYLLFYKKPRLASIFSGTIFLTLLLYFSLQKLDILLLSGKTGLVLWSNDFLKYSVHEQYRVLLETFSLPLLLFMIFGIIVSEKKNAVLLPSISFVLFLYFFPIADIQRALPSIMPIVAFFMATGVLFIFKKINLLPSSKFFWPILSTALLVFITLPYWQKKNYWLDFPASEAKLSIITPSEWKALYWIQERKKDFDMIYSDPVLGLAVSGYSHLNRQVLDLGHASEIPSGSIVLISGRTSYWIRHGDNKKVFVAPNIPRKFQVFPGWEIFENEKYFQLLYHYQDQVYVFEKS